MRFLSAFLILLSFTVNTYSQECKAYIPYEKGTKLEMTSYNQKDKVTGIINQEVTDVKTEDNSTIFSVHQKFEDEKGKNPMETDMTFTCTGETFLVDMNMYVNNEQMEAYKDMQVEVTTDQLEVPFNYSPGQNLDDGTITIKLISGSPISLNFVISVINRKVEGKESITTPAGTFECLKLTQDIVTKAGFTITMNSIEWYAEGVGVVRSESYKKGKLEGYTELTKVIKP